MNVSIAQHEPLLLKGITDVARSWTKNKRGYGLFDRGRIPYQGDRSVEITTNVRVRPYNYFSCFTSFPEGLESQGDLLRQGVDGFGLYVVKAGKTAVLICIGALRNELEREEGKPIRFDHVVLRKGRFVRLQMKVSVRIVPSPSEPVDDTREWDTQFFPGGLPSLGRRRP